MTSIKDERKSRQQQRKERGRQELASGGAPRPAKKVDLDACPQGYDPDIWHLALYFRQVAQATTRRETLNEKIQLEHGLPVIYAYLERACEPFRDWFASRQEKVAAGALGRSGKPLRPVYVGSSKKTVHVAENWVEVVEQAITWHFQKYYEDEYAADTFCQPETFRAMIRESRETARNWHFLRQRDEERGVPGDQHR